MDEEISFHEPEPPYEPMLLCKCLIDADSSENFQISERKRIVEITHTESYLRERRVSELVHFLLTKLLVESPNKPIIYMEKLLNDCMLFRAGHGLPPVLYEDRHLEAVVKSFDPGRRGWLSSGQTRRAFITLGLSPNDILDERIPCDVVFNSMKKTQESELFDLLTAGMNVCECSESSKSDSSI